MLFSEWLASATVFDVFCFGIAVVFAGIVIDRLICEGLEVLGGS